MPFSQLSKEVRDYIRACQHLLGKTESNNSPFSDEELRLVEYYSGEVGQIPGRTKNSSLCVAR